MIWPAVVELFVFLRSSCRSSTADAFRGLPGLLVFLSVPVRPFFLRPYQIADLAAANVFSRSFSDGFVLTLQLFGLHMER